MIDIHSHVLPGVDDGSSSIETSVAVLERFARQGLEVLVCTPHLQASGAHLAPYERHQAIHAELVAAAPAKPEHRHGWEIMLDRPGCDLSSPTLSLGGAKAVLVEFPRAYLPVGTTEELDRIRRSGVVPVVAHPERYYGCTPDTVRAVREVHRVLRPGGRAVVMLYHRDSYNYRVNIRVLRRAGAHLLKTEAGLKVVNKLTGEPVESLREHARHLKEDAQSYLAPDEFLSQHTDGAGNPLARVYSRRQARELFKDFAEVKFAIHFLNKRWLPVLGSLLTRKMEIRLASRWGWHLWIYATK